MENKVGVATSWVKEYSDSLYRYALSRLNDDFIAKDIVQDTFLSAWRSMDNYAGDASVKTWLFTILKNKIIDHYRKVAVKNTTALVSNYIMNDSQLFEADGHWQQSVKPNEWTIDYNTNIETKEFYSILDTCKSKLKEIQNAVFSLKYMDGLNSEEICKVLEISSSNYWVLIHRAKVQLRVCLEKNWFLR